MSSVLIKEIGRVITGNTPSKSNKSFYASKDIGFIKPDLISENKITNIKTTNEFISERARSNARITQSKAVLVTCIGIIGKIGVVDSGEYAFNQQINVIEPNEKVSSEYLAYCLLYNRNRLACIANAPVVPIINKTQFENFQINIVDGRKQQDQIVEVLNKVSNIMDMCKEQIEQCDMFIKSRFVEMFGDPVLNPLGWEQITLKEIGVGKLSYGSGASACTYDGNIRYIRITDIDNNGKLNSDMVSPNVVDEKYMLHDGDILFARSGATVGKTYCYHRNEGKCLYAGYLIRLIPDRRKVLPEYVFYFTKTNYYEDFIASNMKVVAQPNINAKQYGDLLICVPPIDIQKEFIVFVHQIDRLKDIVQKRLEKTQLLFDSLMQQYFG